MKLYKIKRSIFLLLSLSIAACSSNNASSQDIKGNISGKGVSSTMNTYYMGRFSVDVPAEMQQEVQAQEIRYADIKEIQWAKEVTREEAIKEAFNSRLVKINQLERPEGIQKNIIQERVFKGLGDWSKGVCYYGDYMIPRRHFWSVLVDYGDIGVWLTVDGTNDSMSLDNIDNILKHYSDRKNASNHAFHLKHGAINLPYLEQEKIYARFEGHPLKLKLELEMNETHEVESSGLAERLAASLAAHFAPGVHADKIRSKSRIAAGLKGEELVMRMASKGEPSKIQFGWEYRGKVDSGEQPEIQITMETYDGNLDEKLKIWEAILSSFKPTYR